MNIIGVNPLLMEVLGCGPSRLGINQSFHIVYGLHHSSDHVSVAGKVIRMTPVLS